MKNSIAKLFIVAVILEQINLKASFLTEYDEREDVSHSFEDIVTKKR